MGGVRKREVTSVHFKAENVSDQENEIVGRLLAYIEKYTIFQMKILEIK